DLSYGYEIDIDVLCDNCTSGKVVTYKDYYKITNGLVDKYFCNKCKGIKIKNTVKIQYGVENISQLDEIKNKKIETSMKKYNVSSPLKLDEVKDKIKNTFIKNYGVSHPQK